MAKFYFINQTKTRYYYTVNENEILKGVGKGIVSGLNEVFTLLVMQNHTL